jgi:ATP phosphoribosyltransferase
MKYLITLDTPTEVSNALLKNSKEAQKEMKEMMAQLKPEAAYFSTIRRFSILVVNVNDPHVELRRIYEALSKYGNVTVDPVSTTEEFLRFWEK